MSNLLTSNFRMRAAKISAKVSALAFCIALAGCGDDEATLPLAYVPSDSPYVLANLAPMNADTVNKMREIYAPLANDYLAMFDVLEADMLKKEAGNPDAQQAFAFMKALITEMAAFKSDADMEKAGLKPGAMSAFYGVGLVPVFRMQIGDEAKVRAMMQRVASSAKQKLIEEDFGSGKLIRAGSDDAQLVVFFQNAQVIVSLAPKNATATMLELIAPAKPVNSEEIMDRLSATQKKYGFTDDAVGYLNPTAFTYFLSGKTNALESGFIAIQPSKMEPTSALCLQEFQQIAGIVPNIAIGFTKFAPKSMHQKVIFELSPERAKALSAIVAPTPAYGPTGVGGFSMSIDPMNAMNYGRAQANLILANPYKCDKLADLNKSAAEMKESLANPVLGMAGMVKGFGFSLDKLELDFSGEKPTPKAISGLLTIYTDQAEAVYGMMQSQAAGMLGKLPETLKIGEVAPISAEMLGAVDANIAKEKLGLVRGNNMLAIGIGANSSAELVKIATAKPGAPVFLEYKYGGELMKLIYSSTMEMMKKLPDSETDAASTKAMLEISQKAVGLMQSVEFSMLFNANGVEIRQATEMK